jgi:hypothetical protein
MVKSRDICALDESTSLLVQICDCDVLSLSKGWLAPQGGVAPLHGFDPTTKRSKVMMGEFLPV